MTTRDPDLPLPSLNDPAPDGDGRHVVGLVADPGLPLRLAEVEGLGREATKEREDHAEEADRRG